jgi:hypothetical protein
MRVARQTMMSPRESLMQSSTSSNSRCTSPEVDTCNCDKVSPEIANPEVRRRKRSVRFNRETYIQETTHINNMTQEEVDTLWFNVSIYFLCKDLFICDSMKNGTDYKLTTFRDVISTA